MVVPQISRSERKRADILTAARELFLAHGYLGSSVDDVASRARVSKPTVYSHFGSKEALFVAVVSTMTNEASDQVRRLRPEQHTHPDSDVSGFLRAYGLRQLQVVLDPALLRLRRLVIGEVSRFPDLARALFDGGPARAITELATILTTFTERGLLHVADPRTAATHLNWMIMGGPLNEAMLSADGPTDETALRHHVDEAVRIFLAAHS
ncbi:TetR/AcrR family transcriptional regulator [Actinokineospora guangxiensis]|uniref:TetR/AcrR family transcriptional regulator n=1 Tax=Actinokineospora guangxiensis TaxID=1490288 RepID=A0ABW0EMY1_9PSEU